MRIVLHNTTTRKDAVYVVSGVGFKGEGGSEYWVTGYWGRWEKFAESQDTDSLRRQVKYHGGSMGMLHSTTQKLVTEKLCNGYKVVEEYSRLPDWPICLYGQNWRDYREE